MVVSREFEDYTVERLDLFAPTVARRMFGGLGFFHNGLMYALASKNILYFKVNDRNREDFERAGMGPFKPFGGKSYSMSYYELPVDILENDEQLRIWAQRAFSAAFEVSKLSSEKMKKRKRRKKREKTRK